MAGEFQSSTFIGRAVESRRLDSLLERAEQGSPQVVLLAGDAGVGKTRLDLAGALAASVRAAEQAEVVLAPAEALRHLSNTLRLWERVPEPTATAGVDRVELTLRAAAAASAAGEHQRAASLA